MKGDLFLSIHADSLRGEQAEGASIYTLSKKASDAQTAKLAARENMADLVSNTEIYPSDTDIHNILYTMAARENMADSKNLADDIVRALNAYKIKLLKGPHRHAGFAVLKSPDIPSVLFETGFISNERQAKQLTDPAYQKQISLALTKALDNYFGF